VPFVSWYVPSALEHVEVAREPTVVAVNVAVTAEVVRSRARAPIATPAATRPSAAATTSASLLISGPSFVEQLVLTRTRRTFTWRAVRIV
jgi:hypothetical protein